MKTAAILFLLFYSIAHAAVISPIELEITAARSISSFTVTNDTSEPITYQTQGRMWKQVDGENVEENTTDIIITPPIVTIAAGQQQVFRTGLSKKIESNKELTYRVYLEDISEFKTVNASKQTGISFKFNHNLPLFINLNIHTANLSLAKCSDTTQIKNCIRVKNNGNKHFKVTEVTITSDELSTSELVIGSKTTVLANSWIEYKFKSTWIIKEFHVGTSDKKVDFIANNIE